MEEANVHGLVVRETKVGDHDKILTLLTLEKGLITVTGKGVRSLKSKNMVSCQPFTYSSFFIKKTNKDPIIVPIKGIIIPKITFIKNSYH